MGLNFVRSKHKQGGRLRYALFVQPFLILLASFLALYLIFFLSVNRFMNKEIESAVEARFNLLDTLYEQGESEGDLVGHTIDSSYMIVDEKGTLLYLSGEDEEDFQEEGQELLQAISQHGSAEADEDNELELGMNLVSLLRVDEESYFVAQKTYSGVLQGAYVLKSSQSSQNFQVYALVEVSTFQELLGTVNRVLLILMLLAFVLTAFAIYWTARKMDLAFRNLRDYISLVGSRKKLSTVDLILPYQEFKEVKTSVDLMAEELVANQRSQQIFFQNASHELRTPLMSIQGYAEGIADGVVDQQSGAIIIQEEASKMKNLVDDILLLSKLESSPRPLSLTEFSLKDSLYDLTWSFDALAKEKGLVFHHDFPATAMDIQADEVLLERALSNILSNAIRYARTGIWVTLKREASGLLISIANDGPEIAPSDLPHIFERFYQGTDGQFGIGLAITKDIIGRHGGSIEVDTSPLTCFKIFLPLSHS
ncbi:sensor histidine kinase [Streptococcus caprae]|uniref:histidine kinase n=1 Tax=Streptococcus caprae TaxID=1640501 RepID=A0ABV8CXG3_9STRE